RGRRPDRERAGLGCRVDLESSSRAEDGPPRGRTCPGRGLDRGTSEENGQTQAEEAPPQVSLLDPYRRVRPITPDGLWNWLYAFTGVRVAREKVCRTHQAPFDAFAHWFFQQPSLALLLGPRGGGKSFLSALDTH